MGSLKVYAMAGFLAVATSVTARAADLLPPPPAPEPVADIGGGWYLRGDVGVSKYDGGKFQSLGSPGTTDIQHDYGSGGFAGVGVGYQFTDWFRADVTGEYRFSTGWSGTDNQLYTNAGFLINGNEKFNGNYSAAVVLLNGYFDLGTWWGFTPFVGGGVGYAYSWLSGFDTSTQNYYVGAGLNNGVNGGTIRDGNKGNFAWALHAGVSYDVTPNVKLELAYRYLNLGNMNTGVVDCYCGASYAGLKFKDIESHDIKIGMRWMFGAPAPAPEPYPEPIIRKY